MRNIRIVLTLAVAVVACLLILRSLKSPNRNLITASGLQEHPSSQRTFDPSTANYLQLDVGKRWVLRNANAGLAVTLTVESVQDGVATVSFQNPWFDSKFLFRQDAAQTQLVALEVKSQRVPMPPDTVYFDFAAPQRKPWRNSIGSIEVLGTNQQVGKYNGCIQIQETNKQGHKNLWSFAKGVGFVQYGAGKDAFALDEAASNLAGGGPHNGATHEAPAGGANSSAGDSGSHGAMPGAWQSTRIALAHNPFANELLTPFSVNSRFKQALDAGVNYVYLSPRWEQVESSAGKYQFHDLGYQVGQAEKAGLPTILNIRVIDTGARPVPSDLQNKSFSDREMIDRLNALIDALAAHLKGHPAYLLIGNEIDVYFGSHSNEVSDYATLFEAAKAHAQIRWGGTATSTTVTFGGLERAAKELLPITRQSDYLSLTYYPLNLDFTVRDPSQIPSDFAAILRAAKGKKILFQEVGYPSSEKNNSSQEKQAQAFSIFLDNLAMHKSQVIGANFLFMSDFSNSVTRGLAAAYHLQNAERFSSYLQTLGMFDGSGNPKQSWNVFKAKVPTITRND